MKNEMENEIILQHNGMYDVMQGTARAGGKSDFARKRHEACVDREALLSKTPVTYQFVAKNFKNKDLLLIQTLDPSKWMYATPLRQDDGKYYTRYVIDTVSPYEITFWHERAREKVVTKVNDDCWEDSTCRMAIIRPSWEVHFADSMVHKKTCLDSYKTVAIYEPPVTFQSITKKILDKMEALGLSEEEKKILMEEYSTNSYVKYTP